MKLLRVSQAAKQLGISKQTLYLWHSENVFPNIFRKLGRKILLIDEDELRRIIDRSRVGETILTGFEGGDEDL